MDRYNYYKLLQSGATANHADNPACMALQQALIQLPEDLKAGAQQALQTGKCEEFIKMLQEQAQRGGHSVPLEEGMPMAKFGAYFGMPEDEMAYNMKIAKMGLIAIADAYKAQRGFFGLSPKRKKPVQEDPAFIYQRMSPEEKYQYWKSKGFEDEAAQMIAGLKPFPKEHFGRPMQIGPQEQVERQEEKEKKPSFLEEVVAIANKALEEMAERERAEKEGVPQKESPRQESELPPNVKQVFVDSKGELWVIQNDDGTVETVRKYPSPLKFHEYLENNPTTKLQPTQKNAEIWNKNIYLPWAKEQGLMDNFELDPNDPINLAKKAKNAPSRTATPTQKTNTKTADDILGEMIEDELILRGVKDARTRKVYRDIIKDRMKSSGKTIMQEISDFFSR